MAAILRTATGTWHGDLKGGKGSIDATSGVLKGTPFTFATRFENAPGTNPEELIAAAHAACFSMAFSNYLSTQGPSAPSQPSAIRWDGRITRSAETRGKVAGVDNAPEASGGRRRKVPGVEPAPRLTSRGRLMVALSRQAAPCERAGHAAHERSLR
jgi:osmotically inducible protein OsmC